MQLLFIAQISNMGDIIINITVGTVALLYFKHFLRKTVPTYR
jgi:hypothetical protein